MSDIKTIIVQDPSGISYGDWAWASNDLESGDDLETAVLICLFTDCVADPDFVLTDRSTDRRGWWADPTLGSTLWQYARAKTSASLLSNIQTSATNSLQRLVTLGVVTVASVTAVLVNGSKVRLTINLTMPGGSSQQYAWMWSDHIAGQST